MYVNIGGRDLFNKCVGSHFLHLVANDYVAMLFVCPK